MLGLAPPARAVDVTLSASVVGATPQIIGYNSGHFMPGSNTASWWKYSGVNGARVWSTPSVVEAHPSTGTREDDNAVWGDGVATQQQFLDRRTALRANQLTDPNLATANYINWPLVKNNYQNTPTSSNNLTLDHAFSSLRSLGIEPLVIMDRTNARYEFSDISSPGAWGERWEQWQHFYMQAFYLAKNYDIHRFQMYNEPNHGSPPDVTPDVYVERLKFASDAVQAAIADVNAVFGKSLVAEMQAPVTAGSATQYYPTWGEPAVDDLHTNFLGQTDPDFQLFQTYAYQRYGSATYHGPGFASELASIKNSVNAATGGAPMKFALSEFNVLTAGSFDGTTDTLDTPFWYARLGSIAAGLANAQADELYVQKLSQTDGKKNGTHFVDNDTAPYDIGGVTKGGEVVRLFAKGFAGGHELLQTPAAAGSGAGDLQTAASFNAATGRYSLLSSNLSPTASRTLDLDLTAWNIEPGAFVTVQEVSADRHGEVSRLIEVPANRRISVPQPAESVVLVSAPQAKPAYRLTLGATDDAMVKSGGNSPANYGASPNLFAKNSVSNPAARNVAFIKFDMGAVSPSAVEQAILRVSGENDGSASQVITHVYGLFSDNWSEESITWNNAPNLAESLITVNDISHNFVEGIGATAEIVGHFTGTQTERELMLDVTPFVAAHPDRQITFLIAREVRFDGENVDDSLTSMRLNSKESGTDPGPQLLLSLNESAIPADFNGDGVVNSGDLVNWTAGFGAVNNAARDDGDADRDGDVDSDDFLVWQRSLGAALPSSSATVATLVPEPSSQWLAMCLSYGALIARRFL